MESNWIIYQFKGWTFKTNLSFQPPPRLQLKKSLREGGFLNLLRIIIQVWMSFLTWQRTNKTGNVALALPVRDFYHHVHNIFRPTRVDPKIYKYLQKQPCSGPKIAKIAKWFWSMSQAPDSIANLGSARFMNNRLKRTITKINMETNYPLPSMGLADLPTFGWFFW